jgi:hypothetical protein
VRGGRGGTDKVTQKCSSNKFSFIQRKKKLQRHQRVSLPVKMTRVHRFK